MSGRVSNRASFRVRDLTRSGDAATSPFQHIIVRGRLELPAQGFDDGGGGFWRARFSQGDPGSQVYPTDVTGDSAVDVCCIDPMVCA